MKESVFHPIIHKEYIGIITILDYEMRIKAYLSKMILPSVQTNAKKVLVDLALKSGMSRYRFIEFNIGDDGNIIIGTYAYVAVEARIEELANKYLRDEKEIVIHSILPVSQKEIIIRS